MKKKVFRVIAGIMFLISPILALFQNANMMPDSWSGSLGFALSMGAAILLAVGLFLDKFLPSAIGTALYCSMAYRLPFLFHLRGKGRTYRCLFYG